MNSPVARTVQPFKWWQTLGVLLCLALLGWGALTAWRAYRVSQLLGKLKSPDSGVRLVAAEELGRTGSPRALQPLLDALNDPDFGVRGSAATALGQIKDPRAVDPLMAALKVTAKDNNEAAIKEAEALGHLGSPALEPLMAAFKDKDLGGYAASGLVQMGAPAVESLIATMKGPDTDVGWQAANALGEIKDPRAVEPLIAALQVKDLRWNAALALGEIKDPRAVEPLISALQDKDSEFREKVAQSLGEIKDPRADAALTAALKDPEEKVLHAAANSLGQIDDPQADNVLLTAFREHNAEVIAGAGNFFIRRGEPGSEDVLIEALNKSGDQWLAETMLNCGNQKLHDAASEWAATHNYEITYLPGKGSAAWGSKQ
ncbi:MAG: HEAT repeat domain-containing protein [Terracidiphilus sp.]